MKLALLFTAVVLCFVGCTTTNQGFKSPAANNQEGIRKGASSQNIWQGAKIDATRKPFVEDLTKGETVFGLIKTNTLRKSQFETQVEYQSRLNSIHPGNRTFFVELDSELVDYTYDAELSTLTIAARCDFPRIIRLSDSKSRPLDARYLPVAGKRWATKSARQFNITNFDDLPELIRPKADSVGLSFPMARDQARQLVENRGATLVFPVKIGDLQIAAYETLTENAELPVVVVGAMVIDSRQRIVLASLLIRAP